MLLLSISLLSACTNQQYFEGLKAGSQAECLDYPLSEYEDCVDETDTSYREYNRQRQEVLDQ